MLNFAATVAGSGLAAILLVAKLQGAPLPLEESRATATMIDPIMTGSAIASPSTSQPISAIRLIDLKNGATCRVSSPKNLTGEFHAAPLGPDCLSSPLLQDVAQWRSSHDGTLEMADAQGKMVLRFIPGDGVLYESVYPAHALVTIVPAKG